MLTEVEMIHPDITERYIRILHDKCDIHKGVQAPSGETVVLPHLLWMLEQIHDRHITGFKAHRWLGFVQGLLIIRGLTSVIEEREFTRPYLNRNENHVTDQDGTRENLD